MKCKSEQMKGLNRLLKFQRMRRIQIATQIATTRERLYWLGGLYSFALLGLTVNTLKNKKIQPKSLIPFIISGTTISYQIDLAYFSKSNRINEMSNLNLQDNSYWFTPIDIKEEN
jgi:hypothetical protein